MSFTVLSGGPGVTWQDYGREGGMAVGLSRGGAVDLYALVEIEALFGRFRPALELATQGLSLTTHVDCQIALTGDARKTMLNDQPLAWHAAHPMQAGDRLTVGAGAGFAYVALDADVDLSSVMGSVSVHTSGGIGAPVMAGASFHITPRDTRPATKVTPFDRFAAREIRLITGPQTHEFAEETRRRFTETEFRRSASGNRQGIRLDSLEAGFVGENQLTRVSDFIIEGDVQMTGEGTPFVLLADCQTIGGYPRIGTVVAADIAQVAQSTTPFRFRFVEQGEQGLAFDRERLLVQARASVSPLVRDPAAMSDLLSYRLIDGFIRGDEEWL